MRIGLLHTTIREEEKSLLAAADARGIEIVRIDVREQVLNPATWTARCGVMIERCLSTTLGAQVALFLESLGMRVVNASRVAYVCDNKFLTSLVLRNAHIATPSCALVFSEREAIAAVDQLGGYPVVLKPIAGSWGRLIAKINDQDALEGIIEQKMVMGSPVQKALYLQKYVEKHGRDQGHGRRGRSGGRHVSGNRTLDHQYRARRAGAPVPAHRGTHAGEPGGGAGGGRRHSGSRFV